MTPTKSQKTSIGIRTLVLSLFVLLFVQVEANAQAPTQEETNCYNLVQGKVAWDNAGHTSWSDANVRSLCKETTNATGTAKLFQVENIEWFTMG